MTIQLSPEQEQLVRQAIAAGLISAADDVVDVGIGAIRQRLDAQASSKIPPDVEQWSSELHAWVQTHSTATPLLSEHAVSRDSIYGSRGE